MPSAIADGGGGKSKNPNGCELDGGDCRLGNPRSPNGAASRSHPYSCSLCLFLGRLSFLSVRTPEAYKTGVTLMHWLALVTTMFGAAGTLFKVSKTHQNNGFVRMRMVPVYMSAYIVF